MNRTLFLVAYGRDQSGWAAEEATFERASDVVTAIAVAYAAQAGRALRRGVLQGYLTREEALPGLRGRLREQDQLRRRFGFPLPVEVRYDDFTVDILENRLLRTAAQRLLRLRAVPAPTARALRHVDALLGEVAVLPTTPPPVPITRLNEHYRPALALARLVLEATSFDIGHGPVGGTAFLFNMFRVFEDFLTAALTRSLQRFGGRVRPQHVAYLDAGDRRRIDVRPDLTWLRGGRCLAVIDAKYKSLDVSGIRHPDVYQATSYALALDAPHAYLVYAETAPEAGDHEVRGTEIELHVGVLDLSLPPKSLLTSVDDLAARIAAPRPVAARSA